jgi:hypothetical protein
MTKSDEGGGTLVFVRLFSNENVQGAIEQSDFDISF